MFEASNKRFEAIRKRETQTGYVDADFDVKLAPARLFHLVGRLRARPGVERVRSVQLELDLLDEH